MTERHKGYAALWSDGSVTYHGKEIANIFDGRTAG